MIEIPIKKGRPKRNQPSNYVSNKDLLNIIIEYKKTKDRKLYEKIGSIILMITQRFILKPSFASYDQNRKNEMISDACYYMITTALKNFDPTISTNPFSYFTESAKNGFLQHINKTKLRESRCSTINFLDQMENVHDDGE